MVLPTLWFEGEYPLPRYGGECAASTASLWVNLMPLGQPEISNNVGSVKAFLSALHRSLRRVVFLVLFDLCIDDHGSLIIFRSASVRPKHLFDQNFDHD